MRKSRRARRTAAFYDLLAELQIQNKNLDQAAATAEKAIATQFQRRRGGDTLLAQIEVQRGQTAHAISVWENWSAAHPNDAGALRDSWNSRGSDVETWARPRPTTGRRSKSSRISPSRRTILPIACWRTAKMWMWPLSLAQTARRAMPNSPDTADTLAWAYYYKGAYAFARDLLEDAIKTESKQCCDAISPGNGLQQTMR